MLVKVLRENNILKFIDADGVVYKYTDNNRELERLPNGSEVSISPEYLEEQGIVPVLFYLPEIQEDAVTEVIIPEDTIEEKETPDDEIEEIDVEEEGE